MGRKKPGGRRGCGGSYRPVLSARQAETTYSEASVSFGFRRLPELELGLASAFGGV